MNKETIPPSLDKPTFVCRTIKVEDFEIGKNAYEELSEYLGQYKFATGPYRMYDPENYITNEVKAIRGYILPPSKPIPVEDLIANIVAIGEADELLRKYGEIRKVEEALKRTNPDFKGFYTEIPYPGNLRKMVENFDYIMSQMPYELEGEEAIVNRESPKPDVQLEVDVEEEQPSSSTWVPKGNKRQKIMHIPERVVSRALQVMVGNDEYFADIRQNYLHQRETEVGKAFSDLQVAASRLDDRLIQSEKFMKDDDFIKSSEFKSFFI